MKYKVIPTKKGKVLVDGSAEIKEDEICYDKVLNITFKTDHTTNYDYVNKSDLVYKIIASINHSISLDVAMVVVEDEADVAADNNFKNTKFSSEALKKIAYLDFKSGRKSTQQKGVYSEADLINAFNAGCDAMLDSVFITGSDNEILYSQSEIDMSLQKFQNLQNKEYIELEMEESFRDCNFCGKSIREQSRGCGEISCYRQYFKTFKTNRVDGQLIAYVKK